MRAFRVAGFLLPIALLLILEFALLGTPRSGLARPSEAFLAWCDALVNGTLLVATMETLCAVALGVLVGGALGVAAGVCLGLSTITRRVTSLTIESLRPIPPVALIPLALLLFGWGMQMETAVVAFAAIWPVLILTTAAVVKVPTQLFEAARMLNLRGFVLVAKVVLPSAAPSIFVALRLTVGIGFVIAVTTEIATNPQGIGYEILAAQRDMQPAYMYAFLGWLAVLGVALDLAMRGLGRALFSRAEGAIV